MTDKEIQKVLKEDYDYLKTIYPQDRILGVFTFGKATYGFVQNISDIQVKMYYLPSIEDICTQETFASYQIVYNNHTIDIKDIRLIIDNILQQEGTAMECFFSKNYIITPKFKKVFIDNIINKRENIFHCNPQLKIEESVAKALVELEKYKETKDSEYLFEACRRRLSAELYLQNIPVEDCLRLKKDYHTGYLWGVKNGTIVPDLDEIEKDLKNMSQRAALYERHPEEEEMVKTTVIEIVKIALTKTINQDEFLNMLTDAEKEALKIVMNYLILGEGNISVSRLVEESNLSRPVFKGLLQKMKDTDIAEISNMGVKGTYIKIIDGVFLNIEEHID